MAAGCAGGKDKTGKTTAPTGHAPRRGQGRQASSLQLRMSGFAKGRRNDPRSKAFPAAPTLPFSMGKREATPRRRIGLRAKPPRVDSIRGPAGRRRLVRRRLRRESAQAPAAERIGPQLGHRTRPLGRRRAGSLWHRGGLHHVIGLPILRGVRAVVIGVGFEALAVL